MKSVERTERTIQSIKETLLNDEIIRKLLYNLTPDGLNLAAPSIEIVNKLITKTPMIAYETGVRDSYKNAFIAIYLESMDRLETADTFSINIAMMVRDEYYEMNNNKIRGLQLLQRVIDLIDNKKYFNAAKMTFLGMESVSIEKGNLIGHFTRWEIVDGSNTDY